MGVEGKKGNGMDGKDVELNWSRTLKGLREVERATKRWEETLDNALPELFSARARRKYLLFYARLVMLAMDVQEAIKAMESDAAAQLVGGEYEGDHDEY